MPDLFLKDPPGGSRWFPFQDSRPICELRAGAWLIRERWEAVAEGETRGIFTEDYLHAFVEDGRPSPGPVRPVDGPAVVGRSDFVPTGIPPEFPDQPTLLVNDGETVGWWLPPDITWNPDETPDWESVELDGILLHGAYDLVTAQEHFLVADATDFTNEGGEELPEGSVVLGDPADVILIGARVEPGVTFDVREGAVVVEQHAYVKGGTRFEGPVYVGPGTLVLGGPIRWSAFGPQCKVRGEIAACTFLGYANKAHDGFLGHSVIGRWVNLGANTVTSDLKNTYGPVHLEIDGARIETGRKNLGSLIGDHAKTAIGTLLGTGTTIGVGCNVFGVTRPPRYLPPFAWGPDGDVMRKDGFLSVAERVLPRRDVTVTPEIRAMLAAIYDHAVRA
jgi:UDP-N-acetylglucosamine diphosphorylase/glucosamine-1-phosphate N-acetyltransferase